MEIIPIFAPNLYAIVYPKDFEVVWNEHISVYFEDIDIGNIDEFKRNFELWSNPLYLYDFFERNQSNIKHKYWKGISIKDAARITKQKAFDFEKKLTENKTNIESLFLPLDDRTIHFTELNKGKSKYDWLRIYAIKIDTNRFLVTGGAIKLTYDMKDHESTRDELKKIEKTKNYLVELGVIDGDSFDDALYEITL